MGANDIFWRCNSPRFLFFLHTRKYKFTSMWRTRAAQICEQLGVHVHWKILQSLSECRRSIPHIPPPFYLSKLHVSCYLWRDSGELCDLSSFSLIIALMRIKALKQALLVGLLIHMHEDGRIWVFLCCQCINLIYISLSLSLCLSLSYSSERLERLDVMK